MKIATAKLRSISSYSQSRYHDTPKLKKEQPDDYEARTWLERLHVTEDGHVFIPPMAFKLALGSSAAFLSMQIKGKGKATYTKHVKAGVLVTDALVLPNKKVEISGETFFVPVNGRSGGGSRVKRTFPVIPSWEGEVTFYILDDLITEEVFAAHLKEAGNFIGIGRFRPENEGFYGRFVVDSLSWQEQELAEAA